MLTSIAISVTLEIKIKTAIFSDSFDNLSWLKYNFASQKSWSLFIDLAVTSARRRCERRMRITTGPVGLTAAGTNTGRMYQPWAWWCRSPWRWSSPPRPGCDRAWTSSWRRSCRGVSLPGSPRRSPSCPGPDPPERGNTSGAKWSVSCWQKSLRGLIDRTVLRDYTLQVLYSTHLQPLVPEGLLGLLPGPARPPRQQAGVFSHPSPVGVRRGADLSVGDLPGHHPQHPWTWIVCAERE